MKENGWIIPFVCNVTLGTHLHSYFPKGSPQQRICMFELMQSLHRMLVLTTTVLVGSWGWGAPKINHPSKSGILTNMPVECSMQLLWHSTIYYLSKCNHLLPSFCLMWQYEPFWGNGWFSEASGAAGGPPGHNFFLSTCRLLQMQTNLKQQRKQWIIVGLNFNKCNLTPFKTRLFNRTGNTNRLQRCCNYFVKISKAFN